MRPPRGAARLPKRPRRICLSWRTTSLVAIAAAALSAPGCSGIATTTAPSPPASQLADAKAALQSYVDATAGVNFSDPTTFEPVFRATTGDVQEYERNRLSTFHDAGWSHSGAARLTFFDDKDRDTDANSVLVAVCIDSTGVQLHNEKDQLMVAENGGKLMPMLALISQASSGPWLVERLTQREGAPNCPHTPSSSADTARDAFHSYVTASNEVDFADTATFQPLLDTLTGTQLEHIRSTLTRLHDDGWQTTGASRVTRLELVNESLTIATFAVCLDRSEIRVRDAAGQLQPLGADAASTSMTATLTRGSRSDDWLLAELVARTSAPECG